MHLSLSPKFNQLISPFLFLRQSIYPSLLLSRFFTLNSQSPFNHTLTILFLYLKVKGRPVIDAKMENVTVITAKETNPLFLQFTPSVGNTDLYYLFLEIEEGKKYLGRVSLTLLIF